MWCRSCANQFGLSLLGGNIFHNTVIETIQQLNQLDGINFRVVNLFSHFFPIKIVESS